MHVLTMLLHQLNASMPSKIRERHPQQAISTRLSTSPETQLRGFAQFLLVDLNPLLRSRRRLSPEDPIGVILGLNVEKLLILRSPERVLPGWLVDVSL